jgi:hypothetical protein
MNARRKRWVHRWSLLALAVLILALAGLVRQSIWFAPSIYADYGKIDLPVPILTADQYAELSDRHARPYIVRIESDRAHLVLYGATHTKDPDDPQLAQLRELVAQFKPTVLLVEGRLGMQVRWLSDPLKKFGESGFVFALARTQGIRIHTWEPSVDQEVAQVLKGHPKERAALFYILRPYFSGLRHGRHKDPEAFVEDSRQKRTQWPGLEKTFASVAEIDTVWKRDFAGKPDWRDTSDEFGLPGYLHEVWKSSNAARDEHFARVILDLLGKGERVLAVCGSSHAVKLEPAITGALTALPGAK